MFRFLLDMVLLWEGPTVKHRRRSPNPTWQTHVCTSSCDKKKKPSELFISLFSPFVNFEKKQVKAKQAKTLCFNLYFCNFRIFGRHGLGLGGAHTGGGPSIQLGKPMFAQGKKEAV